MIQLSPLITIHKYNNKIDKISVKHYAKLCSYTFYIITNHK